MHLSEIWHSKKNDCRLSRTQVMRYFCPSAIFDYLGGQMGDKMGENLQISKLKIKNLQK